MIAAGALAAPLSLGAAGIASADSFSAASGSTVKAGQSVGAYTASVASVDRGYGHGGGHGGHRGGHGHGGRGHDGHHGHGGRHDHGGDHGGHRY